MAFSIDPLLIFLVPPLCFIIQVKDDDRTLSLGNLTIPLARLLVTPELTMDQWFQLENSGLASRIYIKAVLRVGLRILLWKE